MTVHKLRDAVVVMAGFLALIWALQVFNWADGYRLDADFGILSHHLSRLPDIFAAPFLHVSWQHIEGNSLPLFVLGVLAAYRSIARFLVVSLIVLVTSGMAVWLFQSGDAVTVGASGLIFGYFGYVLVRGFLDRNMVDIVGRGRGGPPLLDDPSGGHPRHARRQLDRPPRRPRRRRDRGLGGPVKDADRLAAAAAAAPTGAPRRQADDQSIADLLREIEGKRRLTGLERALGDVHKVGRGLLDDLPVALQARQHGRGEELRHGELAGVEVAVGLAE